MNSSIADEPMKTVHYVIAVHGIGEQRKNETVLPVISKFAAARNNEPHNANLLTLGQLASQTTDYHWIELNGIPAIPNPSLEEKRWWPSIAEKTQGENIRFVDFVWSDVTREYHPEVGQSVKNWSGALINRLKLRKDIGVRGVDWIIYLLTTMQKGMLVTQQILNLKAESVSSTIFNDYLGDVELYGNFPHTRGRAVRLFHELMNRLHNDHIKEFAGNPKIKPQYTIIAHSLGTVMTLDAITYAYANQASRQNYQYSDNSNILHFPGYNGSHYSAEHSLYSWVEDIDPSVLPIC